MGNFKIYIPIQFYVLTWIFLGNRLMYWMWERVIMISFSYVVHSSIQHGLSTFCVLPANTDVAQTSWSPCPGGRQIIVPNYTSPVCQALWCPKTHRRGLASAQKGHSCMAKMWTMGGAERWTVVGWPSGWRPARAKSLGEGRQELWGPDPGQQREHGVCELSL